MAMQAPPEKLAYVIGVHVGTEVKKPGDYGVDIAPRLKVLKTVEPPGRKAGVKVANAAELIAKLKEVGALS